MNRIPDMALVIFSFSLLLPINPLGAQSVAETSSVGQEYGGAVSGVQEAEDLQQQMLPDKANSPRGCPYDEEAIGQPLLG